MLVLKGDRHLGLFDLNTGNCRHPDTDLSRAGSALCRTLRVPGSPETRGAHRSGWPQARAGDAQRERSVLLVTAPDRQRAARRDFFDQALGQEFADHFGGGADSSALSGARRADVTGLGARIPRVET